MLFLLPLGGSFIHLVKEDLFAIYPNPALNYVTLKYDCSKESLTYAIIDVQGKLVSRKEIKSQQESGFEELLIDLGDYLAGNYQIIIYSASVPIWTTKLVITK